MNISQLEYLIAAINLGSYASAAKSLYISPQAVSKGISDLERELKIKLFVKSGRGIEATSDGALLAAKASEIIQSCGDLKRYADLLNCDNDMSAVGSLAVAVASSPYEGSIVSNTLFDSFTKQYPGIDVELFYSSSGEALSALYEDVVDVSIVLGRIKMEQFMCAKLFESELRIAVNKMHPLAKRDCVPLSSLVNYPIAKPYDLRCCYRVIVNQFEKINFSPHFVDLPPLIESQEHFLKEENGIIFISYSPSLDDRYPDMDFIPLDRDDRIGIPVCIAWRHDNKEKLISLVQKSLIQSLRDEKRVFRSGKTK
jgi:DNA-binding transcriptional LysR family regulator